MQQSTGKTTSGHLFSRLTHRCFISNLNSHTTYLRVITANEKKILTGDPLKYRGGPVMHICLPPCAITSEIGIVCRCNASTRPAVPTKRRFCMCRLDLPFFLPPFLFFSLYLYLYLYLSWSFIHRGIAPVCSCKRFARDIQSMTTYALGSGLATSDPMSMWFAYLSIISPVLPYTL